MKVRHRQTEEGKRGRGHAGVSEQGCSDETRWMLVGVNEGDNTQPVDIGTVLPPNRDR